jgi:hypothetical protein
MVARIALIGLGLLILVLLAILAFGRAPSNILSVRTHNHALLDAMWSDNETTSPMYSAGSPAWLDEPARRCGNITDTSVLYDADMSAIRGAVHDMTRQIYRSEVIWKVIERTPAWRIRLMHLAYTLGLWFGNLETDPPSGIGSDELVEMRVSAERFYNQLMSKVACDAARAWRATHPASANR